MLYDVRLVLVVWVLELALWLAPGKHQKGLLAVHMGAYLWERLQETTKGERHGRRDTQV